MKMFWTIAAAALAILAAAAVWMGGLNQDEGWYLYAANLVSEGQIPYRDFFYTQGPVLPYFYAPFSWIWRWSGLLGARVFTLSLGLAGIAFFVMLAWRLAPEKRRPHAALVAMILLGCNLYHVYYITIPKTYAIASLFVAAGFWLLSVGCGSVYARRYAATAASGFCLALAAGVRISLGMLLATTALGLAASRRKHLFIVFSAAGLAGLALVYGPFLLDGNALDGLVAAQKYHAARGGADLVWFVGSLSRLVRWYAPVFVMLGLWWFMRPSMIRHPDDVPYDRYFMNTVSVGFVGVLVLQMTAPFPYEDYQVPVMGLLAVVAAVGSTVAFDSLWKGMASPLLAVGLCFSGSFGSPLLEKWATNGQDRFWSLKKSSFELPQLRAVADEIEKLDPDGKTLLTQDLYLAVESGRKVPKGLEMGPFAILDDEEWRALLGSADCPVAALSGYSFAIEPPSCAERPVSKQVEFWTLLKKNYEMVRREEAFGQNATPLLILKRKAN